jgi:hypothetical protein
MERKVSKAKKEIEEFDRKHPAALGGVVGLGAFYPSILTRSLA